MSRPIQRDVLNLDGWCVSICPGCGTQDDKAAPPVLLLARRLGLLA